MTNSTLNEVRIECNAHRKYLQCFLYFFTRSVETDLSDFTSTNYPKERLNMALIAPLKGVRYNPDVIGKIDDVVTPPYDVINENSVGSFISKTPYSMIRLDITKNPGPVDGGDSRYQQAAALFQEWREKGVLIRDSEDSLYLYQVEYQHPSGHKRIRKGFVCLVGLADFSEGIIKPHERTFDTVIEDRLKLLKYCKAQFSQVFSLYSDKENEVIHLLEQGKGTPVGSVTDADGCVHSLKQITNREIIKKIQYLFLEKSLYIADGHHRYTTALAYRKYLQESQKSFLENNPANHIMMYLCPMEDPGLSVLPTHRLLNWPGRMDVDELTTRLAKGFELEEIAVGSREVLIGEVLVRMAEIEQMFPEKKSTTFGVYHPGEDRCFLLRMKPEAIQEIAHKEECLRELDVVILSDLIIEKYFDLDRVQCEHQNLVRYFSDPDEALDTAVKNCTSLENCMPLLFVMNPTRVTQVKNVADQNRIMPHKSTYFYPKIMTGLLFNQLVDGERIDRLG
jgi:uncharacterized protein (DUF1015 family)